MKKRMFVLALTLLFSLVLASVAFAHPYTDVTYFNNGYSGWVSDGYHGHYWSGDYDGGYVVVKGAYDNNGKAYRYYDYDRGGQWYYYKDDNGRTHYVYIDPDREGQWHRYYDKNGDIQYYYDVIR